MTAPLPVEPNDHYLSVEPAPYRFMKVDPVRLASGRDLPPLLQAQAHR